MRRENAPIYCGRCNRLALASFRGTPLCPHCLMEAVETGVDKALFGQIRPLSVATAAISGLVKCKSESYTAHQPVGEEVLYSGSYKI